MGNTCDFTDEQAEMMNSVKPGDLVFIQRLKPIGDIQDTDNDTTEEVIRNDGDRLDSEDEAELWEDTSTVCSEYTTEFEQFPGEPDAASWWTEAEVLDGYLAPNMPHALVYVSAIARDPEGVITDVFAHDLGYKHQPKLWVGEAMYQLYRTAILSSILFSPSSPQTMLRFSELDNASSYSIAVNPSADEVRTAVFGSVCPANCYDGFLPSLEILNSLMLQTLADVHFGYEPICPYCISKDLAIEQHALYRQLEQQHILELEQAIDLVSRLNARRRLLGYECVEFDEREWGYFFDDMLEQSDDASYSSDDTQYEEWAEAMDPSNNNHVYLRPASKETIDALPRKNFALTKQARTHPDAECVICKDPFQQDQDVVELPCGHVFCDTGCIAQWLSQFDTCPICRARVPAQANMFYFRSGPGFQPENPRDAEGSHNLQA